MAIQRVPLALDPVVALQQLIRAFDHEHTGFQAVQILIASVPNQIATIRSAANMPEKSMVDQAIALHQSVSNKLETLQQLRQQCESTTQAISNAMQLMEEQVEQQLPPLKRAQNELLKAYREKTQGPDGYLEGLMYLRTSELRRYQEYEKTLQQSTGVREEPPAALNENREEKCAEPSNDDTVIILNDGTPKKSPTEAEDESVSHGTLLAGPIQIPAEQLQQQPPPLEGNLLAPSKNDPPKWESFKVDWPQLNQDSPTATLKKIDSEENCAPESEINTKRTYAAALIEAELLDPARPKLTLSVRPRWPRKTSTQQKIKPIKLYNH